MVDTRIIPDDPMEIDEKGAALIVIVGLEELTAAITALTEAVYELNEPKDFDR